MPPIRDLRQFISRLREKKEIIDIDEEVDPFLEIAEIHRQVIERGGPALFFHHVKGSSFPVVTNLFGSESRIEIAFGKEPERAIEELVRLAEGKFSTKSLLKKSTLLFSLPHRSHLLENELTPGDLNTLPLLTSWPLDGGPFITLPLVLTQPVNSGPANLGIYRIQRFDATTAGLHFQIAKGGGFHYAEAEKRGVDLPVSIFLGGPPLLTLAAMAPLPENVPEILAASLLGGEKIRTTTQDSRTLFSDCEFALVGSSPPGLRRLEGPFGDHYGNYSQAHDYPIFRLQKIFHRKDAIYPATVVGKPKQEDFYLGNYLQKLFLPLLKLVIPSLGDLHTYGESGFHTALAAVVKERYSREAMSTAYRLLGEGQLGLTKTLFLTDQALDLADFKTVLTHILERSVFERDLTIFSNVAADTLDYTGPKVNSGSRMILLGMGEKKRELPRSYSGALPSPLKNAACYTPGCLLVEGPPFVEYRDFEALLSSPQLDMWPLIVLVDNLKEAAEAFLWTLFTQFEPAGDLYARRCKVLRHHLCYEMPLLIDARAKPHHPPIVASDPTVREKVRSSPVW